MGLSRRALLWASRQAWLGDQFRKRKFARRAASRFLPGEDAGAALDAARQLTDQGLTALFSVLGENVTTPSEAKQVTQGYLDLLDLTHSRGLPCQVSLKPTQLGLDLSDELCLEQLSSLLVKASSCGGFIWIDMESSGYVDRTLTLLERARKRYSNAGVCVQSYLYRTAQDLERLISQGAAVRLVKGAYAEPPAVAIQRKRDVDANFFLLAERLLDAVAGGRIGQPAFGTHDMRLLERIFASAAARRIDKRAFEVQILYGIGREHQRRLAADGYRMRVLISYGTAWFPWYMRRLAERPANVWFVVRSIFSG